MLLGSMPKLNATNLKTYMVFSMNGRPSGHWGDPRNRLKLYLGVIIAKDKRFRVAIVVS